MLLIGCHFHTRFPQIAILDWGTGEIIGRRLEHPEETLMFYVGLSGPVQVGMEARGPTQWLERVLRECGH